MGEMAEGAAPQSGLQVENGFALRGWVEPDTAGRPRDVTVTVDGAVLWCGPASRLEHPGLDPSRPRIACGLLIDLPSPGPGATVIEVVVLANGAPIGSARVDTAQRFRGFLEQRAVMGRNIVVRGWAQDLGRYLDAVPLELRVAGHAVQSFAAARGRADLKAGGIGMGNHAFDERFPWPGNAPPDPADIAVVVAGTSVTLALARAAGEAAAEAHAPVQAAALTLRRTDAKDPGVLGICDRFGPDGVSGWAIDLAAPDAPVVLDLTINNAIVATQRTERPRPDIARRHGGTGGAGFFFELTPQMLAARPFVARVAARRTGAALENGTHRYAPAFAAELPAPPRSGGLLPLAPPRLRRGRRAQARVALIVLNRNGADLLDRHFASVQRWNTHAHLEHIVVDHGSTDASRDIAAAWAVRGLRVRFEARGLNHSFSASNNFAARLTKAEIVVFCNNDVFFDADLVPEVVEVLADPAIGACGLRLMDEAIGADGFGPAAIQHLGVHYNTRGGDRVVHPVETRPMPGLAGRYEQDLLVPSLTGAFIACRRDEFLGLGGFSEAYFYGYEDVDLSLKYRLLLDRELVLVGRCSATHHRGTSRKKEGSWAGEPMRRNRAVLARRFGLALRRRLRADMLARPGYWTATRPMIGFAVTEARAETRAGDVFTAYELAAELAPLAGARAVFLEAGNYDVQDVDVLIVMTHDYDVSRLLNPKLDLVVVGWARNWFDAWTAGEGEGFDLLFASSDSAAAHVADRTGHRAGCLRIGSNPARFPPADGARPTDYVFTGHFWGHPRDILYALYPAALPLAGAIYGEGWGRVEKFRDIDRGPVVYDALPAIYRGAKVVIDDANAVTKTWGAANSRVFDALASGALVVTNSEAVSREVFDGRLPVYRGRAELEQLLCFYCRDEAARARLVAELQGRVWADHSYAIRARTVLDRLGEILAHQLRFALKIACPSRAEASAWGDFHFAQGLARALRRLGHSVRIDTLDAWTGPHARRDDVAIWLRGLEPARPQPDQLNIGWIISHPDRVSREEAAGFDFLFVASGHHAARLRAEGIEARTLLQATDPARFRPDSEVEPVHDLLFVGNSRGVMRASVATALSLGLRPAIVGRGWDSFVPRELVLAEHVAYADLPRLYGAARVVLNDHWPDMARLDFCSNRLFDCAAAGVPVVSDHLDSIPALFGGRVRTFTDADSLRAGLAALADAPRSPAPAARAFGAAHSFDARAAVIADAVRTEFDRIARSRVEDVPSEPPRNSVPERQRRPIRAA